MAEPNFTSGPSIPSQEKAVINREEIIANPALSGVAGHDVHARGEVASEGNFENVLKQLNEFREELVGRFDKAKQEVEEIFTLHPETRTVTFEEESKSAGDLFQDLVQKLELIKEETFVEDRTERANEVVREIGESTLEMEVIAEALEEYLYSQANVSAAEAQPTAQVIPFPSQSQPVGDTRAPEVNMSGTDNTSRTPADSNGAQGSGENGQGNKDGRKGGGSGNGGDGGDGDDPKSGASIGDRSKAALLQAKVGARHAEDVSQTNIEATNEPNVPESFPLQYSREAALDWWYAERRTLNERIQAIRDDLDSWDKVVAVIQELGGEDMLTKALESFKHRDLAFDGRNRQVRDRLDAIEAGNLEQFQKPDEPERNLIQARDYYLKAQYMGHRELLAIGEEVLRDVRANPPQKRAVESSERRILFSERLERIYALAEEWKQLMGQFGPEPKRFSEEVAKQLGQESVLNVKRFMDELAKQGKEHGWKGEISKGDKTVAVNKLKFLEKQVAAARVVIERNKQSPQGDVDTPAPSVMATEPASSSVPEVDPATPSVSPEPTAATKPKNSPSLEKTKNSHFDLENGLLNLKQRDKELWYRAKSGEVFIVRPTRSQDVFELWQPGNLMSRHHYRELASWLYAKEVTFAGKKKQPENSSSPLKGEQHKTRKELEKTLQEKLQIFAERMDTSLRAEDPTLSFAKRRGRILAQLPEFAEKVIERFGKDSLLSSDEQEAMIEAHTLSIKLSK